MRQFGRGIATSLLICAAIVATIVPAAAETPLDAPVSPYTDAGEQAAEPAPFVAPEATEGVSGDVMDGPLTSQVANGNNFPVSNPYPWTAGIFHTLPDGWNDFLCSGTLIAPEWVLTTASCVTSPEYKVTASKIRVALGVRESVNIPSEAFHDVIKLYVHPQWSRATMIADVALLRLAAPTSVTPIEVTDQVVAAGTPARVAGWGRPTTEQFTNALQWGEVEILTDPNDLFCRSHNHLAANGPAYRPAWMVCAQGTANFVNPVDICAGDEGGPLMVDVDGQWKLVGLAAWTDECADYYYPGVYTRITAVLPWLQKQIDNPDITACGIAEPIPFIDVGVTTHYRKAVGCLVARGIITTNTARRYNPDSTVTRAQMAAFLWRMNGNPAAPNYVFRDEAFIPSWARTASDWLKHTNLTVANPYNPAGPVTRGQMAAFLWRLAGEPEAPTSCGFNDVKTSDYFASAACWMKETNLTTGWNGDLSKFQPWAALTRGQMASFLYRYGLQQSYWFN
jgi:hypothetical protein